MFYVPIIRVAYGLSNLKPISLNVSLVLQKLPSLA